MKRTNKKEKIAALYADDDGNIFDVPQLTGMARSGAENFLPDASDLIPLPDGADLMLLPGRAAVGMTADGESVPIAGTAVAAILPAGFTRLYLPAYERTEDATVLPLYGYTAAVLYKNEICVAAIKTDDAEKWNPLGYERKKLKRAVAAAREKFADNRIVRQIAHCALKWHCLTAANFFYPGQEAGIPASPVCNANCFGCISLQKSGCCPSPQNRIDFSPTAEEIAEVGAYHLANVPRGIVSFGQGCEGEPSLAAENVAAGIKLIRERTPKGQINMNTNAGFTAGVKKIIDAGLDSMRVSIISARGDCYAAYYRASYSADDVAASIDYALDKGVFVSLNLLHFPGFTDREEELAAWREFLQKHPVNMIQMRNLNVDPDEFLQIMPPPQGKAIGTKQFLSVLRREFPQISVGSFSHFSVKEERA